MKIKLFIIVFIIILGLYPSSTNAYGECDQYGVMAMYESYSNSCKCMSGYVFGKLGISDYCVSGDTVCHDKYGYSSRYDSLSGSCECSYGYVFGKDSIGRTQCISENETCQNQYGYNARSTYGGECECRSGYVFNDHGQCEYGDTVCSSKHGLHASYDSLSNECECDDGYTADDSNQCVQKQNNVYFTLKELDTDERKAIIKSDYDYKYYLISYNSGCYASSFRRYLNHQIVVNLGTDLDLDTWDKIVLQDDNETCDITHKEYADSSTTLVPEEEQSYYLIPQPIVSTPAPATKSPETKPTNEKGSTPRKITKEEFEAEFGVKTGTSSTSTPNFTSPKISVWNRILNWFKWR